MAHGPPWHDARVADDEVALDEHTPPPTDADQVPPAGRPERPAAPVSARETITLAPTTPTGTAAWCGPAVVAVLAAATYVVFSLLQWRRFEVPSWDLGIFTQLARRYAALDAPVVTIKGDGYNLLGDHFHPLLVALGPVYALSPHALTLLIAQDLLFAASVYVVARHAVRVLGALQGTLVGAAYAVSFGIVGAVAAQFHEIAFAVPLLAIALVALLRGRWLAAALWVAPLVFVKEDLGLTVAVFGLVMWWRARHGSDRPRLGLWLAGWGFGWVVLSTAVLIPLLSTRDQWDYGSRIDFAGIATHPWTAVTLLVDDGRKVLTLLVLLGITGLIGARSPVLLIAVPTIVWRFWADNDSYYGFTWHYSAVLMPIAFAALLDGVLLARRSPREWLRRYSMAAAAVAVAVAVLMVPRLDIARLGRPADLWAHSTREAESRAVLAAIPDDASVETDIGLMSYLVDRTDVFYVGNEGNPAPDFLLIDAYNGGWNPAPVDAAAYAQERHPGSTYTLVYDAGGYQLAQRVAG
ncbi:Protein of unknown function DUF2079, membrane [Cellulomonas gilvus ATCC 13127]|uniref:DUF2079 domain-containing protein n=1 Tax=Cellulomonas gilvus (strain ATCC 13127 / NRRL B-14078) TaxID=593907 RepID=F8A0I8_CELGA|nr:Protein of unknown function DUF2079, membrane [Cellulomonas gilvus ATCC 13127]